MKIDEREVLGTEIREDGLHIKLEAKPERVHVRYSFHFQDDQDQEDEAAESVGEERCGDQGDEE